MTPGNSQNALRKQGLEARRNIPADEHASSSTKIVSKFTRSHLFFSARTIACYLPVGHEVDSSGILSRCWQAGKRVFLPVVAEQNELAFVEVLRDSALKKGAFGLWEPVAGQQICSLDLDVVVTPLVAFDAACNRIGMGGGYYDRTFASLAKRKTWLRPKLVGIAFACQEVEKIKANPWDIRLYSVIHEAN